MTDISNPIGFLESRFQWRSDGYEENLYRLHRRSGIGDVDGHLELSGSHLFIEQKWWDGSGAWPPPIGGGQKYALNSIKRRSIDVLVIWSERGSSLRLSEDGHLRLNGESNPLACELTRLNHLTGALVSQMSLFTHLKDIEQRRTMLRDVIDQWAAKADAEHVSRCGTCGVYSARNRWPINVQTNPTQPERN